jgi:hypothetical protein
MLVPMVLYVDVSLGQPTVRLEVTRLSERMFQRRYDGDRRG